ncbi:MAG: hypothetical protein ACK4QW_10915 [Alphaproteobacteria bacterium]
MSRIARTLLLSAAFLIPAALIQLPVAAQQRPAPAAGIGSASLSSVAYATLPRPAYIEVVLADDSPDNVRLAWEMHGVLGRTGWLADDGPTLRLTLETYRIGALGSAAGPGSARPEEPVPAAGEEVYVLGVLEGLLVDTSTGARLWEARAVYRMNDGDMPLGALALAPLLVEALGRTITNEPIRLE